MATWLFVPLEHITTVQHTDMIALVQQFTELACSDLNDMMPGPLSSAKVLARKAAGPRATDILVSRITALELVQLRGIGACTIGCHLLCIHIRVHHCRHLFTRPRTGNEMMSTDSYSNRRTGRPLVLGAVQAEPAPAKGISRNQGRGRMKKPLF